MEWTTAILQRTSSVALWIAFIAGAISISASLMSAIWANTASGRIQRESDERIASAHLEGARAKALGDQANAGLAKAQLAIAVAKEQAARLELEAAKARQETELLKNKLVWRELSNEQILRLGSVLSHAPLRLEVSSPAGDEEASRLAAQLVRAFRIAALEVDVSTNIVTGPTPLGILISGNEGDANRLQSALKDVGLSTAIEKRSGGLQLWIGHKEGR